MRCLVPLTVVLLALPAAVQAHDRHTYGGYSPTYYTTYNEMIWGRRSGPAIDARGRIVDLRPLPNEGYAPETENALRAHSSEWRYRGELCGMLSTWAEQRTCLRQFMRR